MKTKSRSLLYFSFSVGLVIVAILFTTLLSRTKSPESSADIRARAGVSTSLKFTAVVSSIDETEGTITVDNLRFADQKPDATGKTLGSWKVTPPMRFRLSSVEIGSRLVISVNPKTFQTTTHTLTATEISLTR